MNSDNANSLNTVFGKGKNKNPKMRYLLFLAFKFYAAKPLTFVIQNLHHLLKHIQRHLIHTGQPQVVVN